jgi:serine phosphatase RsbU (regulator of sigma subunit)
MKRYRSLLLLILSVFLHASFAQAQAGLVDSLKRISLRVDKDSAAKLYAMIANIFTGVNADSVRKYAGIAGKIAPEKSVTKGDVFIQFGNSFHMENKMDSALSYYNKALIYFTKIGNEKGLAKAYQSFALVKRAMSDYEGAISDSKKALGIYEKLNWDVGIVNVSNNISNCYSAMRNFRPALSYSQKAFEMSKTLNDSSKYFNMMMQLGVRYNDVKKPDSALYYLSGANAYLERNGFYGFLIVLNSNIANAYWTKNKNTTQTKTYLYKSLYYAGLAGASDNLASIYRDMAMCYIFEGRKDSAEVYFYKTIGIIDSLNTQKGLQQSRDLQTKYETEKKELQIQNQSLEIDAKEKQNAQKSQIIWLGALALIGSGFFGIVAFINFRKTKKANLIIENQKMQVELKNEEVTHQKELVEEKQKEIIDSINYAKRIQQAVLTGEDVWNKVSKEHFILFKPKDIVSGDFYWAYNTPNGRSIFALADCTGHGVPGGFMSMLGNSFLNEIVVENKIFKADQILNKLRSKIIAALEQKGMTEQKDGMDISLCVWNKLDNTLEFAGANNPLWIMRTSSASAPAEIIEYKADKMPIGTYLETEVPFSGTLIQLQKDDVIYLSTDGYADQFGGDKGKKLKYKALLDLLVRISPLDMSDQKTELNKTFGLWKSNYEQVDDVSIIGIRV